MAAMVLLSPFAVAPISEVEESTASVSVNAFVSITLIDAGDGGINFGTGTDPNIDNVPDKDQTNSLAAIKVRNDTVSNTTIDIAIQGPANLVSGSDTIPIVNLTYDDDNDPAPIAETGKDETPLTTTYASYYTSVAIGSSGDFWFFLDIPSSQEAGNYSGTISFRGS